MNIWRFLALAAGVALSMTASSASATVLTTHLTADNAFDLYVSTNDSQVGTYVGSGADWGTTYTLSASLTPGVTNYLHVVATNWGGPSGLLGDFSLSDSGFAFANGTQTLLTTPTEWQLSYTGFGTDYVSSIAGEGFNSVGPWGYRPGISGSSQWLAFDSASVGYFSAPVTAVPEPATLGVLGLASMALIARKRRA
jgi:hypothetical protein